MTRQERQSITSELKTQAIILGGWVALMWIVELVDIFIFGRKLDLYGILPRNPIGLRGILFAPFLHGGFSHLISNTIPFLVLGWFVMLQETSDFFVVTTITMVVGGLGVWLLGAPNSVHIGASVLIFGYLGFLLFRGFFERNLPSIFLSILVGFLYGGLVWGVLPSQPHVSWQGHLFGFIGGILAARILARRKL
ncbi:MULTISPECIES: rhomboid family intramembrane serine protease [unclassified Moorena]|uniref:rhomboid family intramembrane serine protease n=1 Tax=unclassified Moorena TaxID=2683338 RepID=UPI0013B88715|nr:MULTISPECIES: rhomboid family intramembrane serine protease [unclassified Moorena]NEQ18338.1 rhomboid family intramembrane serine protease [Moorena sp. SIO3E2]NEP32892.1 rhomboid family intramembrane serine protease [Moorena sp. SIO3B2]NEQ12318.1 rhomboid family intramembrane serine protease [Moorena sp. SIO4E2]NER88202.1 rhomboid family intramembrane serine protease [Moorena sp. SIO3A2]NES45686.1 rhomboid family intramembrane serine protease [Moorena sp. SIO2C4]